MITDANFCIAYYLHVEEIYIHKNGSREHNSFSIFSSPCMDTVKAL